jgi:hypothetical protein
MLKSDVMTPHDIKRWVDEEYNSRFCCNNRQSVVLPNLGRFQKELEKIHPGHDATIYKAITKYVNMVKTARNTCPMASMASRDQSLPVAAAESTRATADEKYLHDMGVKKIYQDACTQPATPPIQTHHGMQSSAVESVDASRTTTNTWSPPSSSHVVTSLKNDTRITEAKLPNNQDSFRVDLLARKLNRLEGLKTTSHTVS